MRIIPTTASKNLSTDVTPFIYLASQSPRRSQLLDQMGVAHQLLLPDASEDSEALEVALKSEAPLAYVTRVTALKLDAAVARMKLRGLLLAPVLCADTTVAKGRILYGKPQSEREAARMLTELSGSTHRVLTSVAIDSGKKRLQAVSESRVTFAKLSRSQIDRYIATGEPMGKAGSYAVQGRAATFISKISGSYSGIMGLPMFETAQLLGKLGF